MVGWTVAFTLSAILTLKGQSGKGFGFGFEMKTPFRCGACDELECVVQIRIR